MSDPLLPFPWLDLVLILALIALNGVLSMSELAIVSSREARLRAMVKSGSSGAKRALDPKLDMWKTAEPVVREWIERHLGPAGRIEGAAQGAGEIGGLVAGVGQRILSSVSKHLVGRFFVALRKELETPAEGAA